MYKDYANIWGTVPGFEHYEANRLGIVRRKETGLALKPFKRRGRTTYVRLYTTPGEARERSVASVIWATFFKRWPDPGLYVCHTDGDSENNSLDNLFLGTRADVRNTQRRRDDIIWSQFLAEGGLANG